MFHLNITFIAFCTKYFRYCSVLYIFSRPNHLYLQWDTHRKPDIHAHAYVVHWERQLSSMMPEDIVCPGVRGCLLHVQIPLSWRLHACPCVWSHWPTCSHSVIIKNRPRAWHGVDRDKRSPLFWGCTVLQPFERTRSHIWGLATVPTDVKMNLLQSRQDHGQM